MEGKAQGIILLSKLQPPELKTKTLRRRRLLNIMTKNLNKKVLLLCAGAGYGKTTLLSHFLLENKLPVVYYHLEKTDAEPVVFFSYLTAGMRRINPAFGNKVEGLKHLFNHPERYLDIIVGTFLNEITENIRSDIFIILEDYQTLQPSAMIDKILDLIFDHMPVNLHFIITSRSTPGISFLQLKTRDEFLELGTDQLRFTKQEIRRLFRRTFAIPLRNKDIDWVEKFSEGWPVSLRLMLQSSTYLEGVRASDYTRMVIGNFLQSQVSLFNYFAQEIFFQEQVRVRDFLVSCSLFEWLSPELCVAITGERNSARVLAELTKRNAFIVRIPEYGYRFHNLFRDFLRSKLTNRKRRQSILLRAGGYLCRVRKYDEALKYYDQANAYGKISSIIVEIGTEFIGQGRSAMLCSYIEKIPATVRNNNALILINYTQALIQIGRLAEAKRSGLRAYAQLIKRKTMKRRCADVLYSLGGIGLNLGQYRTAERYYKKALKVCPPGSLLTRASILNSLGSLNTALGGQRLKKAVIFFAEALKIGQKGRYKEIEASILNNWAMSEQKMGNLHEAYDKLERMVPILERHFSPGCGAGFFNAARLSVLLGYEKEARSILDLGLRTCSPYNDVWSLAALWNGYALLYQETGDLTKARQYADKALKVFEKLGVERLIIITMNEIAKMSIASRDYFEAERLISAIWMRKKLHDDTEAIPILLTEAQLRMRQGEIRQAEDILCKALALAGQLGEILQRFLIHLVLSKLYYTKRSYEECANSLGEAIRISKEKGYDHLLLRELQCEKWILKMIREKNIEKEYVTTTIKKSKFDIHWIDAFLFGVPRVLIDDRVIADDAWRTIKAKKLFFYLLLNKDKKVNSDTLIEALWPGIPLKKGSDSLRKAMQHIREMSELDFAKDRQLVFVGKGLYQIASDISVQLDTDEFDSLYKQMRESKDNDARQQLLQIIIDLLKEGFAVGWYDKWVEERRLYYQRVYEECLSALASVYYDKAMYEDTVSICEMLLSLDFLEERYHRLYMSALAKLGRLAKIEGDYEKLKKVLKKQLKAEPQKVTTELYSSLVKADTAR